MRGTHRLPASAVQPEPEALADRINSAWSSFLSDNHSTVSDHEFGSQE